MFAGPNGSGKSVLKSSLRPELLGVYLNADEIEQAVKRDGWLYLPSYGVQTSPEEILPFFATSPRLREKGLGDEALKLRFLQGRLDFGGTLVNSYLAAVIVEFLIRKLLEERVTFTFETVMSHRSKVDLLETVQRSGYRTYLYFVATDDPQINISRVRNRVELGGHPVPEDKIVKRYHDSLDQLLPAIRHTNRAYIFDNSTDSADRRHTWLAEVTDGRELVLRSDRMPAWFKRAVLDKISRRRPEHP